MPDHRQYVMEYREYGGGPPTRLLCFDLRRVGDDALLATYGGGRHLLNRARIVSLADAQTGEVISDLDSHIVWPTTVPAVDIQKIRQRDKWEWDKKYCLRVIENHFRNKLFALFDYSCVKCSKPGILRTDFKSMEHVPFWRGLERDHHVPISLGGRLTPGNIGVLCTSCNSRKNEKSPQSFYTASELGRVQRYLDKEEPMLRFKFDWEAWRQDRAQYLTGLGIGQGLVNEVLTNEDHRYYAPPSSSAQIEFTIAVDLKEVIKEIEKQNKGRAATGDGEVET
ncbi:MAG: hypothetical protein EPO55_01995 [Reyranella sp.]|uniref:HNH endonuclease n=1 Tax=Reyranella sp. TaxID=1929291 RepID=UPI001222A898|nr:HNH endonuclease [Reyranella sp.]TAJ42430.1 MAG: hypothetical protein EPO55_01995 [Reyranella sp.]